MCASECSGLLREETGFGVLSVGVTVPELGAVLVGLRVSAP